eukprot:3647902-Rhodomonas_salina.1
MGGCKPGVFCRGLSRSPAPNTWMLQSCYELRSDLIQERARSNMQLSRVEGLGFRNWELESGRGVQSSRSRVGSRV